ncbi:MAG: sulfotransferase [Alphaproteobacteria bacterium]|nr:sulfotransferase [Alphaproteobacteria bacterium]
MIQPTKKVIYDSIWFVLQRLILAFYMVLNQISDKQLPLNKPPVFIVGCGNSGTTLVLGLIGRHPSFNFVSCESEIFWPKQKFQDIRSFFKKLDADKPDLRIVEKTPRHVRYMGRVFRIFPDAKIIAMVRDGRDVVCSMKKRQVPIEKSVNRWLVDCAHIEKYKSNPSVYLLKYEDLVTDTAKTLEGVFTFFDEDPCLDEVLSNEQKIEWGFAAGNSIDNNIQGEKERRIKHNSRRNEQINKGLYNDSRKWTREMKQNELDFVLPLLKEKLQYWGYE